MLLPALTLIAVLFQATPTPAPAVPAPPTPAPAPFTFGGFIDEPVAETAPRQRSLLEILDDPGPAQAAPQKPAPPVDDGKMRCRRTDNGFVCGNNEDDMRASEDLLRSMLPR